MSRVMKLHILLIGIVFAGTTACSQTNAAPSIEDTFKQVEPDMQAAALDANRKIEAVPVRVGIDGIDLDACPGFGRVRGLKPDGDNFLSVRAAPNRDAEEIDRLSQGAGFSMCETAQGWVGIVYTEPGDEAKDCGLASPIATPRDYTGPCRSGWVSEQFVELIAG